MRKRILLVFSIYRVAERIFPIIPHLAKEYDLQLLCIGQFSKNTPWYGTDDSRIGFFDRYKQYFKQIYHSEKLVTPNEGFNRSVLNLVKETIDVAKLDLVLLDDCRLKYGYKHIHDLAKEHDVTVIGNHHGNSDKNLLEDSIGQASDYTFVFGKKEVTRPELIPGGIPSNDVLGLYSNRDDYILLIANFLGNRTSPFPINLNEEFIIKSGIVDIQEEYNKPILVKLKSRMDDTIGHSKTALNNIEYVRSIFPPWADINVVVDVEDDNTLISNAFCVIGAPSTLMFKPIQKGKPTIMISGSGAIGTFRDFEGLVGLDREKIKAELRKQVASGKNQGFIEHTIEGGVDFDSTAKYIKNLKKFL